MRVHVIEHPSSDQIASAIDKALHSVVYDGKALGPDHGKRSVKWISS